MVGWFYMFLSGEGAVVSLCFRSVAPLGIHTKLSSNLFPLLIFSPMPVSHFHAPFQGKGREKANKQDLFPEFIFSKGTE